LRDYLYIPLGGNRYGLFRTFLALFITMFLGGLWHGAKWTFVVWGLLHGLFLTIYHYWQHFKIKNGIYFNNNIFAIIISIFLVFNSVCISWIFFRANNLEVAFNILKAMFNFKYFFSYFSSTYLFLKTDFVYFIIILLIHLFIFVKIKIFYNSKRLSYKFYFFISLFMILGIIFLNANAKTFIYFQF